MADGLHHGLRGPTIEDLEEQVHAELQKKALEKAKIPDSTFGKVFSWVKKKIQGALEAYDTAGLPEGVSFDDYQVITKMYYEVLKAQRGGKFVKGKDWMRIVKHDPKVERPIGEIIAENGAGRSMDTQADILDFLLERYLPNAMADKTLAQKIRQFFLFDLGIIPQLA